MVRLVWTAAGTRGFGGDLTHSGGVQPARGGRPQQRVRDLAPPFLVITRFGTPRTVPLAIVPSLMIRSYHKEEGSAARRRAC